MRNIIIICHTCQKLILIVWEEVPDSMELQLLQGAKGFIWIKVSDQMYRSSIQRLTNTWICFRQPHCKITNHPSNFRAH